MKAIILSAGRGERLRPLTDFLPKPMIPVGGKPLLWYNLKLLRKYGVRDVAINTSYLPEKIRSYFGDGSDLEMRIRYSYEDSLLGTSGALNNFRQFFGDEPFFVIYGDNLTDLNLGEMQRYHADKSALVTIFLQKEEMPDAKTTPGAVIIAPSGKIEKIIERPDEREKKELQGVSPDLKFNNSGIYLAEPKLLDYVPRNEKSDFAMEIFPKMLARGESLYGYTEECFFRELGSMKRYLHTVDEINKGLLKIEL